MYLSPEANNVKHSLSFRRKKWLYGKSRVFHFLVKCHKKKKPQLKFKIKKKGQITHLHDDPTEGLVVGGHIKKHPRQSTHL